MSERLNTLLALGNADSSIVQTLVNIYLEDTPLLIQNIENEISNQDSIACKNAAHGLKGSCQNLGFEQMATLCKEIEDLALNGDFTAAIKKLNDIKVEHASIAEELNNL